jgi:pyrimidine-specific ribonucleoside hydrolase
MFDVAMRVLLDVDTGIDDALALLYAVSHPGLDLAAVTCVSGNVALAQVVSNTCSVLDVAAATGVRVAPGADAALTGGGPRQSHRHGAKGLGDVDLPASARPLASEGAVELMRRQILGSDAPVTVVALAPQTNLAMLVRDHLDEVAGSIEQVIFVGGHLAVGDSIDPVEFNVGHDPEAAAMVIGSGLHITMYGLDVFNQVVVSEATTEALTQQDNPVTQLAGQLLRVRHRRLIGDVGALVALTNPELVTIRRMSVRIGLEGAERGRTVKDPAASVIDVVATVDAAQAARTFVDVVSAGARPGAEPPERGPLPY